MNNKQKLFFDLFQQWMNHNGYSYYNAAARLECSEQHIVWCMNRIRCPNNNIIKLWLPTLLENYSGGNIAEIYKTFS